MADQLSQARGFYDRQNWGDAYEHFAAAHSERPLQPDDLERLATAAYLLGRDVESSEHWTSAHTAFLERDEVERAVRCAFWLAFGLLNRGEAARAAGWIARGDRLLEEGGYDCVERGYLLLPAAIQSVMKGDSAGGHESFSRAAEIGDRFDEPDLTALARHGQGRALMRLGSVHEGVALLDETMVAVEAGDVSPMAAGNIYCSVIEACQEIFDLRRATEWTAALSRWCEHQPDLVPYRGECLIRRAEIMQLHGEWSEAMEELEQACTWLTRPPVRAAAGAAFYRRAELHRMRGEFDAAEAAYLEANKRGRKPQPGLARLRLAQGRIGAARAAITRVLEQARNARSRSDVLAAFVEIMLAVGDAQAARTAADELSSIAADLDASFLRATAAVARGSVSLAEDNPSEALDELRNAHAMWSELDAVYESARTGVLIGIACRKLGDEDTAAMELEAARWAFEGLGAQSDVDHIDRLSGAAESGGSSGLTSRELQVLRLVAAGDANKTVAEKLFISERTVERHVSSILSKLQVGSRTAAAAHAYEHGLI